VRIQRLVLRVKMRDSVSESRVPAGGTRLRCAKGEQAASYGDARRRAMLRAPKRRIEATRRRRCLDLRRQEEHESRQSWCGVTSDSRQCDERIGGYGTHHGRERCALQVANTLLPPTEINYMSIHPMLSCLVDP
jgi:hypothetical protein